MDEPSIKKILVVDDEVQFLTFLQLMLTNAGFMCDVAADAFTALKMITWERYDLVVSDIGMSGKDGLELMSEAIRQFPSLKFIVMTGNVAEHTFSEIISAGATDFITKPFGIGDLRAKIQRVQREQRILNQLSEANRALTREVAINTSIAELSQGLISSLPVVDVARLVMKHAVSLTGSPFGYVSHVDRISGAQVCATCIRDGEGEAGAGETQCDCREAFAFPQRILQNRKPVVANAVTDAPDLLGKNAGPASLKRFLAVPAVVHGKLLGQVVLGNAQTEYSRSDLDIVQWLADIYALTIERNWAEEELSQTCGRLKRTVEETVNALGSALEMRDPYTAGHQRRVATLACAIAQRLGFPEMTIDAVRMAGLVHDIGKIAVPSEILSKPTGLTDLETCFIRRHSAAGYDILKEVEFPWPIALIVLQHHERLDGSGYPQGLAGEEILVEARILAVADVAEAMSSHRPYRAALGLPKALDQITENRGKLYDPAAVDACLELFREDGFAFP
jgi:putative nucleotidyltransferase with HDIG domain